MNLKALLAKLEKGETLSTEEMAHVRANLTKLNAVQLRKFVEAEEAATGGEGGEGAEGGEGGIDEKALRELIGTSNAEAAVKSAEIIAEKLVGKFMEGVAEQRARATEGQPVQKDAEKDKVTAKFLRALFTGDHAVLKAMTTGTGTTAPDDAQAGYTIPTELMAEVLRIASVAGVARREMRYLPFTGPGNTRSIPAVGTSVSVSWTDEGGSIASSTPNFDPVTQTLKKLTIMVPMTNEILEDTAVNLTALVAELIAEAMVYAEDAQFLAGTGSPWTGVLNATGVNSVTQTGTGGIADVTDAAILQAAIDATPAGALQNAKWYMHRSVLGHFRNLKGSDGQYIFGAPTDSGPATLLGYPVVVSEVLPTKTTLATNGTKGVFFGDLRKAAILGDKQQLRVKLLEEATIKDTDGSTSINLAQQDMVALRAISRVGYVLSLAKAVTVITF